MELQGKVWGTTATIFNKNNVQVNRIVGKKGSHCSKHKHDHKYNLFIVESGCLKVEVWKKDYMLIDTTTLAQQQSTVVKPGEYHRFEVLEDTVAFEIYWTELNEDDIIREDCGGSTPKVDQDS